MWFAQGYQEFAGIESSVTTKVDEKVAWKKNILNEKSFDLNLNDNKFAKLRRCGKPGLKLRVENITELDRSKSNDWFYHFHQKTYDIPWSLNALWWFKDTDREIRKVNCSYIPIDGDYITEMEVLTGMGMC